MFFFIENVYGHGRLAARQDRQCQCSARVIEVMEVSTATARRKLRSHEESGSGEPWNNGDKSAAAPRFWSKLPVIVLFKHGPTRSAPDTAIPGNNHILSVANL